jgi:hypothetical protein
MTPAFLSPIPPPGDWMRKTAHFVRLVDQSLGMVVIALGYPAVDEASGGQPENIDTVVADLAPNLFDAPNYDR